MTDEEVTSPHTEEDQQPFVDDDPTVPLDLPTDWDTFETFFSR